MRRFVVIQLKKDNKFIDPKIVFDTDEHDDAIDFEGYIYRVARFV